MAARTIAPGLTRWTAFHEEWKQEVGSLLVETPDAVVAIDPLMPDEDVHDLISRSGAPVHVLVSVYWHTRSSGDVVRRHHGTLWAASRARPAIERRAGVRPRTYRPGEPLPGGIVAYPTSRGAEVAFWIPAHQAIAAGDVLLGNKEGGIRLCPASWAGGAEGLERVRNSLRVMLELPVERVLVSHHEPVLEDGHAALAAALGR